MVIRQPSFRILGQVFLIANIGMFLILAVSGIKIKTLHVFSEFMLILNLIILPSIFAFCLFNYFSNHKTVVDTKNKKIRMFFYKFYFFKTEQVEFEARNITLKVHKNYISDGQGKYAFGRIWGLYLYTEDKWMLIEESTSRKKLLDRAVKINNLINCPVAIN